MLVTIKSASAEESHVPETVIFGGMGVGVKVFVEVGVGVTQVAEALEISVPKLSLMLTPRFPYNPLTVKAR